MDIKVLEKTKGKLILEIGGEDHTLCNALKEELNNDSKVTVASYKIEHPLAAKPVLMVQAADPMKAIKDAVKRLSKTYTEFGKAFKKL